MGFDPSENEDEYIKREELHKLRMAKAEAAAGMEESQREELKKLHWMHCPKCGFELTEIAYRGVQVDACFGCGGMFLDKGEAEKILAFEEPGALDKMFKYLVGD